MTRPERVRTVIELPAVTHAVLKSMAAKRKVHDRHSTPEQIAAEVVIGECSDSPLAFQLTPRRFPDP